MRSMLVLLFLALTVAAPTEKIIVRERCFLSFEDGISVLHYNSLIDCNESKQLEAVVRIPYSAYRPDIYPTAFGEGAIIGVPGIYDLKPEIPEAKITLREDEVRYSWNLRTDPKKTTVISFSNYCDEQGESDLSIDQRWIAGENRITARIALKNTGTYPIEGLGLFLSLPEKRVDFSGNRMAEREIVRFIDVETSGELLHQEDFFDTQSKTVGVSIMEKDPLIIAPGESIGLEVSAGYSVVSEGEIEPTIGINFYQNVDDFRFGLKVEYGPDPERMDFRRTEYYQLQFPSPKLTSRDGDLRVEGA
jgi:hypothetical protein